MCNIELCEELLPEIAERRAPAHWAGPPPTPVRLLPLTERSIKHQLSSPDF